MYSSTTRSIRCCTPLRLRTLALILSKHSTNLVKTLIDIAVVDRIRSRSRFTINYLLLSTRLNQRVQLRTFAGETTVLPSLAAPFMRATSIFPAANWLEREV
jgi:NADH:ubiquinone oxidoreductase subunit C